MKLKIILVFFLIFIAQFARANMSSPIWEGTATSTAFTSKDINILSELIHIKIDPAYQTAQFTVEYTVQSDVTGRQIPLLFYAQDYKDSFIVRVDDQIVAIQNIPERYTHFDYSPFAGFSRSEAHNSGKKDKDQVIIHWEENSGFVYNINDLKYFETDLTRGIHKVKVTYTANAWTDVSDWVKQYSFRYSLSPAKFWKSFGTLTITVEQSGILRQIGTNIGAPIEKTVKAKNSWIFTQLPAEYLEFAYTPETGTLVRVLIAMQPFGLSIIFALLLFVLHLFFVLRYRSKHIHKKYSYVVIAGSWLVPFLVLLSYIYAFGLIDYLIGEAAGRRHGYVFLIMVLYPFIVPVYWTIMWLLDKLQKKRLLYKKH
ncbi:MAG: hypothetical protein EOP54_04875 [Sphingobacteriales bacterium]|nr:MAG: hypothetical protein EOP54_04875 [Sphingobacteriales bacterium]